MSTHAALPPGTIFAQDYRVVRLLGEGGMGAVYAAEQLSTGVERALKVLRPELVDEPRYRARFTQEARVAAQIESDHVAQVLAAGFDDATGLPWLAMELLRGETLLEAVTRRGPLPDAEVREIFRELGHALAAAHARGLVHRDLKPENVFLAAPRRPGVAFTVKLLDFGIAKLVQEVQHAQGAAARSTTGIVGSPLWMAPEQTNAGAITPSTDVWALGLLAFYLWTARSYWKAAGEGRDHAVPVSTVLAEFLLDPIEPASTRAALYGRAACLPPGFDAWFARCVVREAAARFRDARAAVHALLELAPARADAADAAIPATIAMPAVAHGSLGGAPAHPANAALPGSPDTAPSGSPVMPRTLATFDTRNAPPAPPAASPHAPQPYTPQPYTPQPYTPQPYAAPIAPPIAPTAAWSAAAMPPSAASGYAPHAAGAATPGPHPVTTAPVVFAAAPPAAPRSSRRGIAVAAVLVALLVAAGVIAAIELTTAHGDDVSTPTTAVPAPAPAPPAAPAAVPVPVPVPPPLPPPSHPTPAPPPAALPRVVRVVARGGGAITDFRTTSATATVPSPCRARRVEVTVHGTHTFYSDLVVTLRSPAGTTATLQSHRSENPFRRFALARYAGEDAAGAWTLRVSDEVGRDAGVLRGFVLAITCE